MKRLIGILLAAAMLVTLIPVAAFAAETTETEERLVYQSSTNFSTTSGDGTWDGGIWSAETVNPETNVYTKMTYVNELGDFGNAYRPTDSFNDHFVTAERISPPVNGQWATMDLRTHWGAKTFTAPRDGKVKVSCVDDSIISYDGSYPHVRIRLESDGVFTDLMAEKALSWPENPVSQGTYDVTLKQGDKIHFEILRVKEYSYDDNGTTKYVRNDPNAYWDPIITYTTEEEGGGDPPVTPTEKTRFVSSENFSTATGDGTWDEGIWSAYVIDANAGTYTAMTTVGTDRWTGTTNSYVDADEIAPACGGNVTDADLHIGAAKTFTAPKDGFVQISYAESTHGTMKGGVFKYAWNQGFKYRVTQQSGTEITTIYPKTGDYLENNVNQNPEMIDANTVTNAIEIKQGDKIHFEILRNKANESWQGVFCDPIVEYIDEADVPDDPLASDPADKKVYKSSENFTDTQNGDYAWRWQYYDINTKEYKNLTSVSQMQGFGLNAEEKAPIWYLPQNTQFNKDRGIAVGAIGMRVSIDEPDDVATDAEKAGELERNYPVKSFTAPKRGSVTISADVFEPGHTSGGAALRIIKHSLDGTQTKLYPTDADWINIYVGDTFTPITTELEKGDILTFENALWKNNSAWQAIIRWDPVITYTKLIPVMDDCNTEIGATDVPLNKEHILTYSGDVAAPSASEIKIYEVASDGEKTESNATVKSVTADGKDLKIVFDGLKPYTKYEIEVGGVAFEATPDDTAANTLTFTTGPVVMIGEAEYADGKVTVDVNNSQEAPAKATLAAFLCKGTETEYTVENVRIITRTDIGANDSMEAAITLPSGDYFIKAMVLEDALTARAYAPMTILRGEN